MLFNSIEFLIFLPLVFGLYWGVKSRKAQNILVVLASYVFYGWWDWRFLILIAVTTLCSYVSGVWMDAVMKCSESKARLKAISAANIILNLGILCLFKYFNFFASSFADLLNSLGVHVDGVALELILPVGISFYTFQALSYSIDVYRRKIEATHDIVAFVAYISFFPQLVAGPIERASNLLPQFLKPRTFDYEMAKSGCKLMLWGFFKKMCIADNASEAVDAIFANVDGVNSTMLLVAAILFTFQIYGDFSGYSDIAIGTARLFGITLLKNFNLPYLSRDIAEFWRRWHISLNKWFIDYLYIPLGGSRVSKPKVIRNTFVIFLVSGLWHGADWTFVLWGLYHAVLFVPLIMTGNNRRNMDLVAEKTLLPNVKELVQMASTFALVVFGWIIFRADNIAQFFTIVSKLATPSAYGEVTKGFHTSTALLPICILVLMEWFYRKKDCPLDVTLKSRCLKWAFYVCFAVYVFLNYKVAQQFIYFQF